MKRSSDIRTLTFAAVCLALAMVLPFLTGQIPEIGKRLSPMHIPVLLCGFICGWPWGLAVGFIAPLLRSVFFDMPALFPDAVGMMFELAAYGFLAGLLYRLLPRRFWAVYAALVCAMIGGRIVWGIARYFLLLSRGSTFTFNLFLAGAFINAVPGIILHIVLVPPIVLALEKAGLADPARH